MIFPTQLLSFPYKDLQSSGLAILWSSGNAVLLRDISGGVSILNITDYSITQLSTSVGNGVVQWADPFDVIVGQESPDAPLYVWYNPTDIEDAPEILQPLFLWTMKAGLLVT